jgi:hypothetical protein
VGFIPSGGFPHDAPADRDGMKAQEAVGGLFGGGDVRGQDDKRGASLGDEGREEILSGAVGEVEGAAVGLEDMEGSLDDETVEFPRGHPLRKSRAETMQEVEHALFLLMDLRGGPLEPADMAPGTEEDAAQHHHPDKQEDDGDGLE